MKFLNVKKLNLFCNFWSSKYSLHNCNATISVCCEKMFALNCFLWFFPSISALWLPSLKNLQGFMVFEQLIYKDVFSKPTSYMWEKWREILKLFTQTFDTVKDCLAWKHQQIFFENLNKNKKQIQKTMFVKISCCHLIKMLFWIVSAFKKAMKLKIWGFGIAPFSFFFLFLFILSSHK